MNALFSLCTVLISFFTGTSSGCLFTQLIECIPHVKKRHFRFSYVCICLTVAIIAATICFFIRPDFAAIVEAFRTEFIFHAVIFGTGFVCGIIPQFFIPMLIFLYALFFGVSDIQLIKVFGSQYKTAKVTQESSRVILQDKVFSVPSGSSEIEITYSVYRMNRKFYLLQDRDWLYVSKITAVKPDGTKTDCYAEKSIQDVLSGYKFTEYFVLPYGEKTVTLPSVHFYPAYFTIERTVYSDDIELKVDRYF